MYITTNENLVKMNVLAPMFTKPGYTSGIGIVLLVAPCQTTNFILA